MDLQRQSGAVLNEATDWSVTEPRVEKRGGQGRQHCNHGKIHNGGSDGFHRGYKK